MSDLNHPLVGLKCSECRDHKSGLALPILEDQVKIAWDVLGLEINYSWRGLYLLSTLVSSCQRGQFQKHNYLECKSLYYI